MYLLLDVFFYKIMKNYSIDGKILNSHYHKKVTLIKSLVDGYF